MNFAAIKRIVGQVVRIEAVLLLLPCLVSLIYREEDGIVYFFTALLCLVFGQLLCKDKPASNQFYTLEAFVMVALCWVVLSALGALPFVLTGDIPNYIDALFETVSGFTTTGSSILENVEALSHANLFWRSFTHWVGGMGVIVLLLAVLPLKGGFNMHLMKAESPGPSVSKLVPRLRDTARILYIIYAALTVLEICILLMEGMPLFDALTTSFGTAGTGGFGIKADSIAGYAPVMQYTVTIFMILFGVNFNAYFYLLGKDKMAALRMGEVRWYFGIIAGAILLITVDILHLYGGLEEAFRHASFQVGSIITTTGFATADFDAWPAFSKTILVTLMFVGACAGSTGGGVKVSRVMILLKSVWAEIRRYSHPRSVNAVKIDGKAVNQETLQGVRQFFMAYIIIFVISLLLISLDDFSYDTNFTAIAATFNNIGPGLGLVGPTGNFADYSYLSKLVMIFDMLAGRLELFPMLLLVTSVWKRD